MNPLKSFHKKLFKLAKFHFIPRFLVIFFVWVFFRLAVWGGLFLVTKLDLVRSIFGKLEFLSEAPFNIGYSTITTVLDIWLIATLMGISTVKSALNKLLYCYVPIFLVVSLVGFSWNTFFFSILALEVLDKLFLYFLKINFTAYYYWALDRLGLFVFKNINFLCITGLISLWAAFLYFPNQVSASEKDFLLFFLPTYLTLFSISVTLFFTVLHRAIDKYAINPSRIILSATNLKVATATTLFSSFYFSFLLLSSGEANNIPARDFSYWILFQAGLLTYIFIQLISYFYQLSSYGFIDSFAKDISRVFFRTKAKGAYETAQKLVEAERTGKKQSIWKYKLILWINQLWYFTILGSSRNFLGNYLTKQELEVVHEDIISIFRMAQKSVKGSDIKVFRACCHSIDEIFKAYVKSGNFYSSNDFTLNLRSDIETLYNFCLEQKYEEEYLAIIVQMVINMIYSASELEIKNMHGTSQTSTFEDLLVSFCLRGWTKTNSNATSLSINGLRDIGSNYVAQKKFRAAHSPMEKLYQIGKVISQVDSFWGRQMSKYVINGIVQIYGGKILALEKDREPIMYYQRGDFRKWITDIYTNLYKQEGFGSDSGHAPACSIFERHYFYDENRITPLWIFIVNLFPDHKDPEKRKHLYKVWEELEDIFLMITNIAYSAKTHESDRREFNSFLYAFLEMVTKQYDFESEDIKKLMHRILERHLPSWFHKEYCLAAKGDWFDTEDGLYRALILLIILSQKDEQYKAILLESLSNTIEIFNSYSEENDPYEHKRSRLYEDLLMIGAWMYKFFGDEEIYQKLEELLLASKDLKRDKFPMMGGRRIESFILENYPEENDFILRKQKIWESEKHCFNHPKFSLREEDYKFFCDHLNAKIV